MFREAKFRKSVALTNKAPSCNWRLS